MVVMNIPQLSDLNHPGYKNKLYIKKNYPEFYQYLLDIYKEYNYKNFIELLYCYYNHIHIHPKCPICNKDVPFLSFNQGYQKYCSLKCSNRSDEVKTKKISTSIERYGTPHPSQNIYIKEKLLTTYAQHHGGIGNASKEVAEKQHKTMLKKYGVITALSNNDIKDKMKQTCLEKYDGVGAGSNIIKNKIQQTNLDKYGHISPLSNSAVQEKSKQTNLNKYGHEFAIQSDIIKDKLTNTKQKNFIAKYNNIIGAEREDNNIIYIIKCPHDGTCNKCKTKLYKIGASYYWDRLRDHTEPCTHLLPVQKSNSKGTTIELFIRDILDKYNIYYETNNRYILNGKELDIYIPDKKIAIECNGCYWHSLKDSNYHINKYKTCREQGIQLLTIWQDWIYRIPEIVKSIILSKLGIYDIRLGARSCQIKLVPNNIGNQFLNENHIQGAGKSKIKLGLYYNDKLLSIMTFNTKRSCSGNKEKNNTEFELARFCTLKHTQIIGAAAKLLNYFINNYHPSKIISFASNDISNGHLYKTLGFTEIPGINKSYWYIDKLLVKRYHRSTFTKKSIIERGWAPDKDKWTEKEAMYNHGYFQLYDSGQIKYELLLENC